MMQESETSKGDAMETKDQILNRLYQHYEAAHERFTAEFAKEEPVGAGVAALVPALLDTMAAEFEAMQKKLPSYTPQG